MCAVCTTGVELFFKILVCPSIVQISAQKVQEALGLALVSTRTIPLRTDPPCFYIHSGLIVTAKVHIYPALTCLTGTRLQWIPFISTFVNLPSMSGPISNF